MTTVKEKNNHRNTEQDIDTVDDTADDDVIHTLRTAHQNQTQLLIIADQKANILVGIVAVILTILFANADGLSTIDNRLFIPVAGFVLLEVIAMGLAVLVIMPKTSGHLEGAKIEDVPNLLFFGFFTNFTQEEYVNHLTEMLKDNRTARQLLATDLYQIGVVLKWKYILLKYAYIFAVIGVVVLLSATVLFLFIS